MLTAIIIHPILMFFVEEVKKALYKLGNPRRLHNINIDLLIVFVL